MEKSGYISTQVKFIVESSFLSVCGMVEVGLVGEVRIDEGDTSYKQLKKDDSTRVDIKRDPIISLAWPESVQFGWTVRRSTNGG